MQMSTTTMMKAKLPEGSNGIANLMGMQKEEVRAWPYYTEVRSMFKDYNLKVLSKEQLVEKLIGVSVKCAEDGIHYFSTGVDKAIGTIRICY